MATMDYAEINVDQKYHRHIIGKGGASGECICVCLVYDPLPNCSKWLTLYLTAHECHPLT